MSRKGRESKKRRIAKSRRRVVRRYRGYSCAALHGGVRVRSIPGSDRGIEVTLTIYMSRYFTIWDAIDSMARAIADRIICCRGCLYTSENYEYCGLGMSPDVRGCNHRELLMEESHD